ncbi:HPr family phosphocarrier protein [Gottfriedia luciferensis]|uniref:HPr family phosphocarrier protein n=1 Tax=Gottfriedia luciferensis TaxID=178774 RepID=UPI000B44DD08|nr:HPr family phosphocarrier protein [Gottfriedia luciferensis]
MVEKKGRVLLETGIQARPAAQFVQVATRFRSEVLLEYKGRQVNVKSIMGVMSLAVPYGEEITITVTGDDEVEAMEAMLDFIGEEI